MTNGEKLDQIFPDGICPFSHNWLKSEYKQSNSDEDCISREQAIRIAEQGQLLGYEWQFKELCKLSSIQPKAKVGHWVEKDGFDGDTYYDCSECGESWTTIEGTPWNNGMKYCPNCGAKMEETE